MKKGVYVKIDKSLLIAEVSGGDAGPGIGEYAGATTYKWTANSEMAPSSDPALFVNTLNAAITAIMSAVQLTVQSGPRMASGGFYGDYLSIGAGVFAASGPNTGQLQVVGGSIDISAANLPTGIIPTNISSLPSGVWELQPMDGCTWPLTLDIS